MKSLSNWELLAGGNEAPNCSLHNLSREVCCLPEACVRDVKKTLSHLIKHDYYLLVVIQVGSWVAARRILQNIKRDFASFGKMLKVSGMQVVFFSVHQTGGWVLERRKIGKYVMVSA